MTGADIQLEGGNWSRIHNTILERLALLKMTGREASCLFFLLRMTYGYQRKFSAISLTLWAEGTGINKRHVKGVVDGLIERNIIVCDTGTRGRGNASVYGFNKYFEQWGAPEKVPPTVPNETTEKVRHTVPFENGKGTVYGKEKVPSTVPEKVPPTVPIKERSSKEAAASAAANFSPQSERHEQFCKAYEVILGEPPSRYVAGLISRWSEWLKPEAWRYALEECADNNNTKPGYLKAIIRRIESEGFDAKTESTNTLNFAIDEVMP